MVFNKLMFWIRALSWFWKCNKHPCPFTSDLGFWRMLEVPDGGLQSWSWFGYDCWSLIHTWSKFWLTILLLKVQITSMSIESWFGAIVGAGESWLGFGILILIWIWPLVLDTPIFRISALYLDFDGAKNIHVHWVLI